MSDPLVSTSGIQSVSELGISIQRATRALGSGIVEAEIRKINIAASGHWYLELADAESVIGAVVWKGTARTIPTPPKQGDLVQAAYERIDFYPPHGKVQLILSSLAPTGEGELLRRRQETLKKLTVEGLTDPSKHPPLPAFPRKIGLISGKGSDAAKDVVTALGQRFAPIPIVFCPALVQGVDAPASVMASIATLNQVAEVDVIILARGGGSVTDLCAFDDEALCRAIFASPVPVITSIGHTKDRPVCDHVSAAQSEVPARTAELAVAVSKREALEQLDHAEQYFALVRRALEKALTDVHECAGRLTTRNVTASYDEHMATAAAQISATAARSAEKFIDFGRAFDRMADDRRSSTARIIKYRSEQVTSLSSVALERARNSIARKQTLVEHQLQLVKAADISSRGAIFATDDSGELVRSVGQVREGQDIDLHFTDGSAKTTVTETNELEEQQ